MPEDILSNSIMRFAHDFNTGQDINLNVVRKDNIDLPLGQSITNNILEWYIIKDGFYRHHLLKRDYENSDVLVSLKANEDWSDILIETNCFDQFTVEFINVVLLEVVFRNCLLFHDGLVIHSSCLEFEGEAVAFAAPSGTGKSTHTGIWQKQYDVTIINDDHPAIRMIDGIPIIYGTPWAGERQLFQDTSSPLKGIVILEQGTFNKIWTLNNNDILKELFPRCFLPYHSSDLLHKAAIIFTEIMKYTNVFKLICRPEPEAAILVKDNVWPKKINNGMISYE
jgi:hypothetical protein